MSFTLKRDVLMLNLRPAEATAFLPAASDRRIWDGLNEDARRELINKADAANQKELPKLSASLYMNRHQYAQAAAHHRHAMDALVAGACAMGGGQYLGAAIDAIWQTLERSSWADPLALALPDIDRPTIDASAAHTAGSLSLALALLRAEFDAISPMIAQRINREITRRMLVPLAREVKLQIADGDRMASYAQLLCAALLTDFERDDRWLSIRYLCGLIERELRGHTSDGCMRHGLEQHLRDSCALSDILMMLSIASGGAVELRDEPDFARMAGLFAQLFIAGDCFLNPGGDGIRPNIDPDALFLLGDSARLGEVCALASYLNRGERRQRDVLPLMDLLQHALYRNLFLREPARVTKRPQLLIQSMKLAGARVEPFYAALSGAEAGAFGDFTLFNRDRPLIQSLRDAHNIPTIDGINQADQADMALTRADLRYDPNLSILTMDIGHAYPKNLGLSAWQRSVMMQPGAVRLMDLVEFEHGEEHRLQFQFVSARKPTLDGEAISLGEVLLRWEGDLQVQIDPLSAPDGAELYRIALETAEAVSGGKYAFIFEAE